MTRWSREVTLLLLAAAGMVLLGCGGGGDITRPATTTVAKTATNSGDAQSGAVGQPLGSPLQVFVTSDGTPSAGVTVSWSTAVAGGSLVPASGVTDANGIANSAWTLGSMLGAQTAQAAVSRATGSPLSFTATAAPGAPAALTSAGGDQQSGNVNEQLAAPLLAKVEDQFGNGVPNVDVNWESVGGTVSSGTVPTDAGGISQVQVTLGLAAGPITFTAVADGLLGSPLTFGATAHDPSIPTEATVQVGPAVFFLSLRNGSGFIRNENGLFDPAVDTVAVGGTVTWIWAPSSLVGGTARPHNVESKGTPSLLNSEIMTGGGHVYTYTFTTAGTYEYKCGVHGGGIRGMSGRIVVR